MLLAVLALSAVSVLAFLALLLAPRRWEAILGAISGLAATVAFVALLAIYATGGALTY